MKNKIQLQLIKLIAVATLVATPLTGYSTPITYIIDQGSSPGFSGSWLHTGNDGYSNGYYMNGSKASMKGTLTLNQNMTTMKYTSATGQITGNGDLGSGYGNGDWVLNFAVDSSGVKTFTGGVTDLISLSYRLLLNNNFHSTGTFYFANQNFGGNGGPNSITSNNIYLWGNNWVNTTGDGYSGYEGTPFGLDLYGHAVPAPGIASLMLIGLLGIGASRRLKIT